MMFPARVEEELRGDAPELCAVGGLGGVLHSTPQVTAFLRPPFLPSPTPQLLAFTVQGGLRRGQPHLLSRKDVATSTSSSFEDALDTSYLQDDWERDVA